MSVTTQIAFRHVEPSEALSDLIHEEAERLSLHATDPVSCHVTVEPLRSGTRAKRCRVRVEARIRGTTFVANRAPSEHEGHDDAYLAVREAFRMLRRQVDDHLHRSHERRVAWA